MAQDGIEDLPIPWSQFEVIFIGGTNDFKESQAALDVCKCAKLQGKKVHVGRVNTVERLLIFKDYADSIDGSGMSRWDRMLNPVVKAILTDGEGKVVYDFL